MLGQSDESEHFLDTPVNAVSAPLAAADRGIEVRESKSDRKAPVANLVAGSRIFAFKLPIAQLNDIGLPNQYHRLNYTVSTGPFTAGTLFSFVTGAGDRAQGAPSLADNVWLYGGTREEVVRDGKRVREGKVIVKSWKQLTDDITREGGAGALPILRQIVEIGTGINSPRSSTISPLPPTVDNIDGSGRKLMWITSLHDG